MSLWTKEQINELLIRCRSKAIHSYTTGSVDGTIYHDINVYKDYTISTYYGTEKYKVVRNGNDITYEEFMKLIELKAFW